MKTALGLMSGTSMDGIDVALLKTDGLNHVEFGPHLSFQYSSSVRADLEQALLDAKTLTHRDERIGNLAQAEALVTSLHKEAVLAFLRTHEIKADEIDVIGFHGQTVLHRPEEALTVQLGDGALLAQQTGIDVIYDMRANDMRAGGQGAPLVPLFHQALVDYIKGQDVMNTTEQRGQGVQKEQDVSLFPLVFVNIGGISNITYVDEKERLIAFDTGPGNALLDQWMTLMSNKSYDAFGQTAVQGHVIAPLAERYLSAPYFSQTLPKSLDRHDFLPLKQGEASLEDGAKTLAYVTAAAIFKGQEHMPCPPKTWLICGGGRHNKAMMAELKQLVEPSSEVSPELSPAANHASNHGRVFQAEEMGLEGDMLEAQAFAYLAVRSMKKYPLTMPSTTGCREPVTGGIWAKAF